MYWRRLKLGLQWAVILLLWILVVEDVYTLYADHPKLFVRMVLYGFGGACIWSLLTPTIPSSTQGT